MFGSTIIDVAIGLIFIFFLLSIIASNVNTLIASFLDWRSKDLEAHIRKMLADPDLANKVLANPLITGLATKAGRTPSHIPGNTFALAIFETLVPPGDKPTATEAVRAQVAKLPDGNMKSVVLSMVDKAQGNITLARANLEQWYDQSMDRLSDKYKRRMQALTLFVGLLITLIFGVDAIELANSLYKEPGLRAALAGAAAAAQSQQIPLRDVVSQLQGPGLAIGWTQIPTDAWGLITKAVGLLLTTLAISLGAPFWYDLLKNLSNVRSASSTPPPVPAPAPPASSAAPVATEEKK